jgi:hypothetical protein
MVNAAAAHQKTRCYLNELGRRVNEKIHALKGSVRAHDCLKGVKSSTDLLYCTNIRDSARAVRYPNTSWTAL